MTAEIWKLYRLKVALEDAVAYYNQQTEELGYQLAVEVQKTLTRIAEFPEACA
jgi:hypothetical protein